MSRPHHASDTRHWASSMSNLRLRSLGLAVLVASALVVFAGCKKKGGGYMGFPTEPVSSAAR